MGIEKKFKVRRSRLKVASLLALDPVECVPIPDSVRLLDLTNLEFYSDMLARILIALLLALALSHCQSPTPIQQLDLAGEWRYQLDEANAGIESEWFNQTFEDSLTLPAALRDQGIGEVPTLQTQWTGSIYDSSWYFNPAMEKYREATPPKFPFWLTPETRYVGAAWYQKEVIIPENWAGKPLELFLERPHWQTQVWFDSTLVGDQNSLSTPHEFSIPAELVQPGTHRISIRVDNAIREVDPGINSHSISDHTQGNWNGIVGEMKLSVRNEQRIASLTVSPILYTKKLYLSVALQVAPTPGSSLVAEIAGLNHEHQLEPLQLELDEAKDTWELAIPMGDEAKTWSEFSPNLYELTLTLQDESGVLDVQKRVFGMRDFAFVDKRFTINGTEIYLRGTTDCNVYPLTGYPPVTEEEWAKIYDICQAHGLNHMRFHSYCPPEAAFIAADKAGIYLQVEGPSWAKYSVTLGDSLPIDDYLMEETRRIIDTYGHHPSFCMMAYGNEPSGNYVPYLEKWVDVFKHYDPGRVFTGASTGRSWSIIENSDFIVRSPPRGLAWRTQQPESEFDYRNNTEGQERPYVTFEMGQWCVFPNFDEIPKYTGPLKARNFELFQQDLADHHMADLADDFLMASGKLQALCYKQEIEATLRTPNLAGFQLLSLNDFSGQGTALVGVLDAFWEEKGYISPEEFKAFCDEVVPLARLSRFTFSSQDTLYAAIEAANFSGQELTDITPGWELLDEAGEVVKSGKLSSGNIPVGNCYELGSIAFPLNFVEQAGRFTLKVSLGEYRNQWNIWVYPPANIPQPARYIVISKGWDRATENALKAGKNVLLLAAGNVENGKDVIQYFNPAFWNTSWFRMRPPHTTGVLIQDEHPALTDFPTDSHSDLQWWSLVNRQQVMNLENFPPNFRPIVQPIDTWFLNRRLAMLFEAKVYEGKLLVCSADLTGENAHDIVAQQLYQSLMTYMTSDTFTPAHSIDAEVIAELFEEKEREVWKSYVKENP